MEPPDLYALLMRLRNGGRIVSSADLTPADCALAQVHRRIFVDKDGFGYVYLPPDPRIPA